MKLAAASDVHAPVNLEKFRRRLENAGGFDILLLAGDVVNDNDIGAYRDVIEAVPGNTPIYAVFGNEEYEEYYDTYKERFGDDVEFLDDDVASIDGLEVVGSTGSLDRPTWWQRNNKPELWRVYAERVDVIDSLLESCSRAVLLTHYTATYRTLEGERRKAWPEMGSQKYEEVIEEHSDTLEAVFHGHAHGGLPETEIAGVPVYNAAVTVRHELPVIEI